MIFVAGLLPSAADAQAPRPSEELARLDAVMPTGVEIVFAVHDAAAARSTAAGRAAATLLEELGALDETRGAWHGLAQTLGWSPRQAFDELLGRRVTFVGRGMRAGRPAEWAVIGVVSEAAALRLRSRLRPVPRGIVSGRTVLSVEDGAFELVLAADRGGDADASTTFVLAPAESATLLAELIPFVRASPIGEAAARGSNEPRAVLVVRGPAMGSEGSFIAVTAVLSRADRAAGVQVRLLASTPGGPEPPTIGSGDTPPQASRPAHATPARVTRRTLGAATRDTLGRWLEDTWSVRIPATLGRIDALAWEARAVEADRIEVDLTIRLLDDAAAIR